MAEAPVAAAAHRLLVSRRALERIERHAETAYPEECCGILVGREAPPREVAGVRVERVIPAENSERAPRRRRRYAIDPRALFQAHKLARGKGLEVVGYYHSHPDHPARPSRTDRERAWPGVSYLIVAVERGRAAGSRCWRLDEGSGEFMEGEIGELR